MSEFMKWLAAHAADVAEHTPFVLATGAGLRVNWAGVTGTVMAAAVVGTISGLVSGQLTVVRLDERVAELSRRIQACEDAQSSQSMTLADHAMADQERWVSIRERLAACEASHAAAIRR